MALQATFSSSTILRSESLGTGAYGTVYKARCDKLLCAAKILHPTLVIPAAEERNVPPKELHKLPEGRFSSECSFMSALRHPNIVQFLGTREDPESKLPVLLMELMGGNLTGYLDEFDKTLPLYNQVNIGHDIALALSFLHSNGIIHRDLSSNNILMIGDTRAKVTDFGMAKLFSRGELTANPGTEVYMPPEAQDASYTTGIDCFSFGVLVIQIITLLYPKPGSKYVPVGSEKDLHKKVSEVQRRQNHIELIEHDHPLLLTALECLQEEERKRPCAGELCDRLEGVKRSSAYSGSKKDLALENKELKETLKVARQQHDAEVSALKKLHEEEVSSLKEQHSKALQALTVHTRQELLTLIAAHESKLADLQDHYKKQISRLQETIKSSDADLQFNRHEHMTQQQALMMRHALELKSVEEDKDEWKQKHDYVRYELKVKLEEVLKLQKQVQDLEEKLTKRKASADRHPVQDMKVASPTALTEQKPSLIINWKLNGQPAPVPLLREDSEAVFCNSTLYIRPGSRRLILAFKPELNRWREMPRCPHKHSTLTYINKTLLAVGGRSDSLSSFEYFNSIFYLTDEGGLCRWKEADFRLKTKRCSAMAVNTGTFLVVAGGEGEGLRLKKVEVMDTRNYTSQSVADLPDSLIFSSATFSQGCLYFLGGETGYNGVEKNTLIICSLDQLLSSRAKGPQKRRGSDQTLNVWSKFPGPPVTQSACVAFQGQIFSIGGRGEDNRPTSAVYAFNTSTNSWHLVRNFMNMTRSKCFAVVLPGDQDEQTMENDKILVVGGNTGTGKTDSLETGSLLSDSYIRGEQKAL